MNQTRMIPVGEIFPHPDNPRKELGDLTELAESIKANGIFQNLTVIPGHRMTDDEWRELAKQCRENGTEEMRIMLNKRISKDGYTAIIGHRRLAASKLAGLTEVPCVVTEMTPKEQVQTMLLENMQRSELTVYEQAQGFQMMLDLGASVEEISEKSGFSVGTVRRRVKMMELDQETLKEVSGRQLSIGDFDKLARIEDVEARNEALKTIGTTEFDSDVMRAMNRQAEKKNMPLVRAWLKKIGAVEISEKDAWSSKYESHPQFPVIYLSKWGTGKNVLPEKLEEQVYYVLDNFCLYLYQRSKKKKKERKEKTQAVKEREQAVREAWKALDESAALAYNLRKQFVENLVLKDKNRSDVLYGAFLGGLLFAVDYNMPDKNEIFPVFGVSTVTYDNQREDKLIRGLAMLAEDESDIPSLVYASFGDAEREMCVKNLARGDFPIYGKRAKIITIYEWLKRLGYQLCREEMELLDGINPGYHAGEAYKCRETGDG